MVEPPASEGEISPNTVPLTAFVSFPSPYTQSLIVKALISCLSSISISLLPPDDEDPPRLQWADYDLISFDKPHASPSTHLISSYIYRKALIRKHQLHLTITEYLAKCDHRGVKSVLKDGGVPKGWVVDLQFADELDELLMDDLYELAEGMQSNEEKSDAEKSWYILKPGFADRAQGIRMFSSEYELRAIFESFEPPSSDEEDEDDDDEEAGAEKGDEEDVEAFERRLVEKTAKMGVEDEEEGGTGVMTSQLRHFVIQQEYMPRPMLFDIHQSEATSETPSKGRKFHLRAYVLLTGDYTLHLSRTLLALFSSDAYTHPTSSTAYDDDALRPHLTNTCLQTDELGQTIPDEELVKLFWELEGLDALALGADGEYGSEGKVGKEWLKSTFEKVGEVVAESVRAGVECGSFGLQLMPNAFEIFGVDLLLSFPPTLSSDPADNQLPIPTVTLLEFNASPDFVQSGDRLKPLLADMFKGVVHLAIAPFFGIHTRTPADDEERETRNAGDVMGWRKIGEGQVRGPSG
ncbi:tubulin-tyrosine ligase family-domain-containing protein [Dioszegia hungarica]|uniref:Tubulin-tyrosine ligase family-domain-containing protein n=1 Tax=Dioszegia hungarica TaxID=4972 RepID=A0AA38HCY4_9TREE|nr:tubulin-tyrosine ligase family-domain-containing protein [Dioszegia hungarica]KAI9638762.1 tubulin-tyrosine ligase family-domain-containing protein [Dioszegia hungarica]